MDKAACQDFIWETMNGWQKNVAVFAAMKLGLFDIIAQSPGGCSEEHVRAQLKSSNFLKSTQRFLDGLAGLGYLNRIKAKHGSLYRIPDTLYPYLKKCTQLGSRYAIENIDIMVHGVLHGNNGAGCYSQDKEGTYKADVDVPNILDEVDITAMFDTDMLDRMDFSCHSRAVDLGGGSGLWACPLSQRYPQMDVTVVEFREIDLYKARADSYYPHNNVAYEKGDFMKGDFPAADLYILSHVLHNWTDQEAKTILTNVAAKLLNGGEVLIIEKLLNEDKLGPEAAVTFDLFMLPFGSIERTLSEYEALLNACGLSIEKVEIQEGKNYCDFMLARKTSNDQ